MHVSSWNDLESTTKDLFWTAGFSRRDLRYLGLTVERLLLLGLPGSVIMTSRLSLKMLARLEVPVGSFIDPGFAIEDVSRFVRKARQKMGVMFRNLKVESIDSTLDTDPHRYGATQRAIAQQSL